MLSALYVLLVYSLIVQFIIYLSYYFTKPTRLRRHINSKNKRLISVVVAVRNEEQNLITLINALMNQNLKEDLYEVIIVDDYSNDSTFNQLISIKDKFKNLKVLKNNYSQSKKNALKTGIENSEGNIIALTDADCIPNANWLKSLSEVFDNDVDIVIGYSPIIPENKFLNKLARFENYTTSYLMTAFFKVGYPYMCFGRNLAYRKSLYENLRGFQGIEKSLSGDDDLFLQKAIKQNAKIFLNQVKESIVYTRFDQTFRQFINQKTRHVSASKYYIIKLKIILGIIYLSNILLTFSIVPAILYFDLFISSFWLLHMIIKILEVKNIQKLFEETFNFILIPVLETIYSFLLIIFGILSRFKVVRWK